MNAGSWFGFAGGFALGRAFFLLLGASVIKGVEISHYLIIFGCMVMGFVWMYRDSKK